MTNAADRLHAAARAFARARRAVLGSSDHPDPASTDLDPGLLGAWRVATADLARAADAFATKNPLAEKDCG